MDVIARVIFVLSAGFAVTYAMAMFGGRHGVSIPCFVLVLLGLAGFLLARGRSRCTCRRHTPDVGGPPSVCQRCGHSVSDRPGARFCPACGERLKT